MRSQPPTLKRRSATGIGAGTLVLALMVVALVSMSHRLRSSWWILTIVVVLAVGLELAVEARSAGPATQRVPAPTVSPAGEAAAWSSAPVSTAPGPALSRPSTSGLAGAPPVPLPPPAPVLPDSGAPIGSRRVDGPSTRSAPPQLQADALWIPKSSHSTEQHEDGWAIDVSRGRVAVADGASSAFMAREWAGLLTASFVAAPPSHDLFAVRRWVEECTADWMSTLEGGADEGHDPESTQRSVGVSTRDAPATEDWWSSESQRRGSFATFVGVQIGTDEITGDVCWDALAVGDSCLVHLRRSTEGVAMECAFPIESSAGYGGHPELIATSGAEGTGPLPVIRTASGTLQPGDVLLVMTDALAQWSLACEEAGTPAWSVLLAATQADVGALVIGERRRSAMVDDDVTLVRVTLS